MTTFKDDDDAITETAFLLRSPANSERLLESIERARRGEFEEHELLKECGPKTRVRR